MLVLAALTLVTIDARSQGTGFLTDARGKVSDAFAPLQRATHAALRPIGNFLTGALDYGSLKRENETLRRQLAQAETGSASAQAERQEAEQIMHNAGITVPGSIPTVAAQIINVGPSNFDDTITIDKGTAAGLSTGQPVIAAGGLIGSVQAVQGHTATIQLLTDPSFRVGLSLAGGNIGSAEGTGRSLPLRVTVDTTNLPEPVEKVGTVLYTSGLAQENFPKAIPVGKVTKVTKIPGENEPDIQVTPLVDPFQVSFLEVLLWSPP